MIKDETKKLIDKAIEVELQNALEQGTFADIYHAYAILRKKAEEAQSVFFDISDMSFSSLNILWKEIKENKKEHIKETLFDILASSKEAMAELAQAAAVCKKAQQQFFGKEEKTE